MKTTKTRRIKLEQDEPNSIRLGLCNKTISLLKSFKDEIVQAFNRVSWEDMQHNEGFIADCLARF